MKTILLFILLVFTTLANAQFTSAQNQYLDRDELFTNPGFENGKFQGWTYGGAGSCAISTSAIAGSQSILCTTSSNSFNFYQDVTNKMSILDGSDGTLSVSATNTAANAGFCVRYNSNVMTGENACVTFLTDGKKKDYSLPIQFNAVATGIEVFGNTTTGLTKVDSISMLQSSKGFPSPNTNYLGDVTYAPAANCVWGATNTSGFSDFAADSDCNTAVASGSIGVPATKIPAFTLPGHISGVIQVTLKGLIYHSVSGNTCFTRFSDGTTTSNATGIYGFTSTSSDGSQTFTLKNIQAGSAKEFRLQGSTTSSGSCQLAADSTPNA
jgi:hypothetical protein